MVSTDFPLFVHVKGLKKPKKGVLQRVMLVCIGRKLRFNKCIYNFLF